MILDELEKLAKEATQGEWEWTENRAGSDGFVKAPRNKADDPYDIEVLGDDTNEDLYPFAQKKADGQFIAAANPETIQRLISVCRKQHEALASYRHGSAVKHPQIHERGDEALTAYNELNGGKG